MTHPFERRSEAAPICYRGVILATGETCPICAKQAAEQKTERMLWDATKKRNSPRSP